MILIGPHVTKFHDLNYQRLLAKQNDWNCFQTLIGNPQSYTIPDDIKKCNNKESTPLWIWHTSYTASANPNERCKEGCGQYLQACIHYAKKMGIYALVLHTGAVSGKMNEWVLHRMESFFKDYSINRKLGTVKLAVEMSACVCDLSLYPNQFIERFIHTQIGWCLDLAHTHAAGLWGNRLLKIIKQYPPVVCHCNFPGSEYASGRDIHGWRTTPEVYMYKRGMYTKRTLTDTDKLTKEYDEVIRLLVSKNVPLIVEGSGFPNGNTTTELAILRSIV